MTSHIKNEMQYRAVCDRINELLKVVSNETPSDDKNLLELDLMSDMVADYEEEHGLRQWEYFKRNVSAFSEPRQ